MNAQGYQDHVIDHTLSEGKSLSSPDDIIVLTVPIMNMLARLQERPLLPACARQVEASLCTRGTWTDRTRKNLFYNVILARTPGRWQKRGKGDQHSILRRREKARMTLPTVEQTEGVWIARTNDQGYHTIQEVFPKETVIERAHRANSLVLIQRGSLQPAQEDHLHPSQRIWKWSERYCRQHIAFHGALREQETGVS